jgi:hypothetical protein
MMGKHFRSITTLVAVVAIACGLLTAPGVEVCSAQSVEDIVYGGMGYVQEYLGPFLPPDSFCNTFRSEIGAGAGFGGASEIRLIPESAIDPILDLRNSPLNENPVKYTAYGAFRFWRLGARVEYERLQSDENGNSGGQRLLYDFSPLKLGGDVDIVVRPWWSLGVSGDYYLSGPILDGRIKRDSWDFSISLRGERPITIGAYVRYTPPDILNMPLHFEARGEWPIEGTKVESYSAWLVFRPQIYRFDAGIRLGLQKRFVTFSAVPDNFNAIGGAPTATTYKFQSELDFFGVLANVYF